MKNFLIFLIFVSSLFADSWESWTVTDDNAYSWFAENLLQSPACIGPDTICKQNFTWIPPDEQKSAYFIGDSKARKFLIKINDAIAMPDSFWISNYWAIEDSLDKEVVRKDVVNLSDFTLLPFDSLHHEYNLLEWMRKRPPLEDFQDFGVDEIGLSLDFIYRKNSSYFAYCNFVIVNSCLCDEDFYQQYGDNYGCGVSSFYVLENCLYRQIDSQTVTSLDFLKTFSTLQKKDYARFVGGCPVGIPNVVKHINPRKNAIPYKVNGTHYFGNASSVVIRNAEVETHLKK